MSASSGGRDVEEGELETITGSDSQEMKLRKRSLLAWTHKT